jgi:anthranilate phosphoribosyltransferase
MLTQRHVETLITLRLSESEIREYLLELTPEFIDARTLELFVEALRSTVEDIGSWPAEGLPDTIDCSGTGGSGVSHFNTSTAAAFVLAAGGLRVAKFGNRAMTSACGSFDFLQAIGFPLGLPPERVPELLEENGVVFLFAPQFYPALARFTSARRSLDVKTIFNFLGPLLNPARPAFRVMGVSDADVHPHVAEYLSRCPELKKALVVRAANGLDEIDAAGPSEILEVEGDRIERTRYEPQGTDGEVTPTFAVTAQENAELFHRLLDASDAASPCYRMVCLNAGAGFYAAGKASSIDAGYAMAKELLASGAVADKYEKSRRSYASGSA